MAQTRLSHQQCWEGGHTELPGGERLHSGSLEADLSSIHLSYLSDTLQVASRLLPLGWALCVAEWTCRSVYNWHGRTGSRKSSCCYHSKCRGRVFRSTGSPIQCHG